MTIEQVWLAVTGAVALVALLLAALTSRRAARAEARADAWAERLALLESPVTDAPAAVFDDPSTFLITHVGDQEHTPAPVLAQRIEGRLFADIVARETVVKAAAWTHGLRRALAPETRNRIRFQMRLETKRAGRERKAEMKRALREYRARDRAVGVDEDVA